MYHTISNIDKTINLLQYIDNRDGSKLIGLKSLTFIVGWYNLVGVDVHIGRERTKKIPDGFYTFYQIADVFQGVNITLTLSENNGLVSLQSPEEIKMSKSLRHMLGFNKRRFLPNQTHLSDRSADFVSKQLYLYLEQLNTSENYYDGIPSKLLSVIPIGEHSYGDILNVRFEHPEFKHLSDGTISELKIEVRDENGVRINNHGLAISCVLEIK